MRKVSQPTELSMRKKCAVTFVGVLLLLNVICIFSSFSLMKFQYVREEPMRTKIQQFLSYYEGSSMEDAANRMESHSAFWFSLNVKVGLDLLIMLVIFVEIALLISRYSQEAELKFARLRNILLFVQVVLALIAVYPFSAHGHNGPEYLAKKNSTITLCEGEQDKDYGKISVNCAFSYALFSFFDSAKALIIFTIVSLAGITASNYVTFKYPFVLMNASLLKNRREEVDEEEEIEADANKEYSNEMKDQKRSYLADLVSMDEARAAISRYSPPNYDLRVMQAEQAMMLNKKVEEREYVKNGSDMQSSFWNNSGYREGVGRMRQDSSAGIETTTASISAEEEDHSENLTDSIEHRWQPNYITFSAVVVPASTNIKNSILDQSNFGINEDNL